MLPAGKLISESGSVTLAAPASAANPAAAVILSTARNQGVTGFSSDGGYAEVMIASEHGLAAIPDGLVSAEAAPLLCAGVTTYNALRNSPARPGDWVAVQGVGGLGHLGIQFTARWVTCAAIGRGKDKRPLAERLGENHYMTARLKTRRLLLEALGGAKSHPRYCRKQQSHGAPQSDLSPRGRMVVVGVGFDGSIEVSPTQLVFGSRSIEGAKTGSAIDIEDTLSFSVLKNVRPMIETVPLVKAADAYARMMRGEARFRMVPTTGQ